MTTLSPLFTWRGAIASPDSKLDPTTRLVALTLSLHMNERGGSAFPGAPLLAEETGLSERSVRDHLKILVGSGWLDQTEKGGQKGERRRANAYRACVPAPLQELQGSEAAPLQLVHATPAPAAPQDVIEDAITNTRGPFEAQFELVWAVYPRKVNKAGALKAYVARRREGHTAELLHKAAENYAAARRGEPAEYTMHGATFFGPNQRWQDWQGGSGSGEAETSDTWEMTGLASGRRRQQ